MFRDGRRSIGPQANIELQITVADWPKLRDLVQNFGVTHQMSFLDQSKMEPGVVSVLSLDLCTDAGVNIAANDQRWASKNYGPLMGGGTPIRIYEVFPGSGWQELAKAFVHELDMAWPGGVKFRDRGGHIVPASPELQ